MKLQATRWMGIAGVAAIAATAGGFGLAQAASSSGNLMTAITPCRLVDTRAGSAIGPRATPLGAGETATFAATGDNGQCVGIDLGASAVEVQLTSTGATKNSFLTLFPANLASPPNISQLNPQAGIAVVSNTTTVTLSPDGKFKVFNESGTTDVVIDVLGVFVPGSASGGLTGPVGPQGPVGPAGAAGAKGDKGAAGADGSQGPKGDTGLTGAAGADGSQGPKGDTGLTGAAGPQGPKGDTGLTGADGPQGPKGDIGLTGIQGPKGDKGAPGLTSVVVVPGVTVGPNGGEKTAVAICPIGAVAISGGFVTSGNATSIRESRPSEGGTGWTVVSNTPANGNSSLQAYAVCATVAAP